MLARLRSAAVVGVDAQIVVVEVDVAHGIPSFTMVGLPDASVRESRDRVKSAIKNTGLTYPSARITVNLAPADIRKVGSSTSQSRSASCVPQARSLPPRSTRSWSSASCATRRGHPLDARRAAAGRHDAAGERACAPCWCRRATRKAALVDQLDVWPIDHLREALDAASTGGFASYRPRPLAVGPADPASPDFSDVRGQVFPRRALEESPRPALTTSCSGPTGVWARPCWHGGCPGSCRP